MTRQPDDQSAPRSGGRSGNDYLVRGGEGYESWAAEGPSGAAAEGGLPGHVPSLENTATWRASVASGARPESRGGGGGVFTLLVGVSVGAALMYFLDRERGAGRRRQAADQLMGAVRSGKEAARGAAAGVRERVARGNGAAVESEVPRASTATVVADIDDPVDLSSNGEAGVLG